jgi:hypothetical protein
MFVSRISLAPHRVLTGTCLPEFREHFATSSWLKALNFAGPIDHERHQIQPILERDIACNFVALQFSARAQRHNVLPLTRRRKRGSST